MAQSANQSPPAPWWSRVASRLGLAPSRLQDAAERLLSVNSLWAAIFVAVLTPLVSQQDCGLPSPGFQAGSVASATIKAPYDIEILDEKATRERRGLEARKVSPVFDHVVVRAEEDRDNVKAAVAGHAFPQETQEAALRCYASITQGRIVAYKDSVLAAGAIIVREVRPGEATESVFTRLDQIRDLDAARAALAACLDEALQLRPAAERRAVGTLAQGLVAPNLSYNASETEARRAQAMTSVPDVLSRIPRGRVIVREGEIFTPETLETLDRISRSRPAIFNWKGLAGNAILLSLLALFLWRYIRAHLRLFNRVKNLYSLALCVSLLITVGAWVSVFVANAVADRIFVTPFNNPACYYWAIPVSAGAMLITLLANTRVATVCSAIIAMLFGMMLGWNAQAILYALLSSFAAIYGISRYRQRTAILRAGAWCGLVNAVLVFAIACVANGFSPVRDGLLSMAAGLAGGLLSALVVSFCLPPLEWLFNVLTDIRLLELSNLDNPLLRQLSVSAPGTYNHSVIVGTLAEQAAEEIGAHALLCRVAAYYHDIGKMAKPEYFIENIHEGGNRHDRISPRMSSLVIANHVKEGLRLAEQHNLPRQVRDMIPQHHGTRLITFFYHKAKRREDPSIPEIHESDYRYPGPRPQTREAAIFMMADSVEAAARSVDEPTPARFEEVIDAITNAIILDHQFDECDLTFSDLGRIRQSFLKTLMAVHHHRIAYPGFEFDRSRPRAVEAE